MNNKDIYNKIKDYTIENLNKINVLDNIFFKYKSDKTNIYMLTENKTHCHPYTKFYDYIFNDIKNDNMNILEIGIGIINKNNMRHMINFNYVTGASIYGWRDYFINSNIYAFDIDPNSKLKDENRIKTYILNQIDEENIINTFKNIKFNIIIDDGCHIPEYQIKSLNIFIKNNNLSTNFLYIIEDCIPNLFELFKNQKLNTYISDNDAEYIYNNYNIDYIDYTPYNYSEDSKLLIITNK